MNGPYPKGSCFESIGPTEWSWETGRMKRGKKYKVAVPFVDADGHEHRNGEEWEFVASMFSRLDDRLTLCVRFESDDLWQIPLVERPEAQQHLIEGFRDFVIECNDKT
jgi:hypothetical protein